MKVLGISGSPRKGGNTDILVTKALEAAKAKGAEVNFIGLAEKEIRGCIACTECGKDGRCVIDDDLQGIYPMMDWADAIILGTPIYFGTMAAQAKILMDRTYFLHKNGNRLEGKLGGVITVGGRAGHDLTAIAVMDWFTMLGMILPGGCYAQSFSKEKGAAEREEKAVQAVRELGERLVNFQQRLK
jgi:multimeric flavodoxin WrbA